MVIDPSKAPGLKKQFECYKVVCSKPSGFRNVRALNTRGKGEGGRGEGDKKKPSID